MLRGPHRPLPCRPEERAALPDLSDRILIFCRGFEPVRLGCQWGLQGSAGRAGEGARPSCRCNALWHACQPAPPAAAAWLSPVQARMRGRYLWQKLELLLSFYLLAPLWAALVWVLQQVGSGGRPGGGT